MKKSFIKAMSLMLTMALLLSTFSGLFSMTASAMDLSNKYEVSWDHTLTDEDGNTFTWYGGINASSNIYGHTYANTTHTIHDYTVKRLGLTGSSSNWTYDTDYVYAFCIEPGVPIPNKTEYTGSNSQNHGDKWERMSENQQKLIQLALAYGYPNRHVTTSKEANACYASTQLLVWQIALNWRTSPTDLNDQSYPMSGHSGTMTQQLTSNPYFKTFYDAILSDMAKHYTIPSFARSIASMAQTYELTPSGGQYTVTLNDANNVLSDFYVSNNGGLSVSISGNNLTITSQTPITSDVNIELKRRIPSSNFTTGFLIWSPPGHEGSNQDMVTGVDADPVPAFLKVKVSTGNLAILKTTQHNNGSVSGFWFEVRNSSGTLIGTYSSGADGIINIPNLQVGVYSVKEVNLSSDFVEPTPNPKSVTIEAGKTVSISFDNVKKRGIINVRKSDANPTLGGYSLAGAEFEVRDAGNNLVDTIITGSDGRGQSKILPLGVYRITEVKAPYGFTRDPNTYTSTLSGVQGTDAIVYSPDVSIAEPPQVARINIVKTNADKMKGDYNLSGATFEVRADEDMRRNDGSYYARKGDLVDTIVVDSQGKAVSKDLRLGNYVVTEKTAPYGYVRNTNSFPVKLEYGGQEVSVVTGTATVPETPQTGRIRIHKYNAAPNMGDYDLKNAVFEIRAAQDIKCLDGTVIYNKGDLADTITTNSDGETVSKELPLGSYTVREKTAPFGFVLNTQEYNPVLSYAGQEVSITYTDVTIPENPQVGTITVTKYDIETYTTAQGDATLRGAVFEVFAAEDIKKLDGSFIYRKDQLVDTLNCGNETSKITKELPLGSYYVKEKTPPKGYTLDTSRHDVTIEYQGQNIAVVRKNTEVNNRVIKGQISLVKHTDDPDPDVDPANPQIEAPLEGAIFEVYLKSAGSYANAKATERDRITTNSDGYAITKLLPYGVYTVKEIYAPGDVKMVDPFDTFVSRDGSVNRYILDDPWFRSLVKILKVDSETGKQIPAAGVSFRVKDLSTGNWVVQHINYPTPVDIDIYETAPDGTLVMPETLKSGTYELYEVQAPYGYVLAKEPVRFTIHSTQSDPTIIEVLMANNPAKGTVTVEKKGNMLIGVNKIETAFGTQYTPVYGLTGLKGAVFNVVAAEDIYTPDGTLRYAKNTVVDTITTGSDGTATSKQLYLGTYNVIETKAPDGFVLDKTPHSATLTYENQNVPVVTTQIGISNTRQMVEIELQKLMERPVNAPDGFNAFKDVTFGLYADEDIRDVNGNVVIAKGNLVTLMTLDGNGKGVIKGELPLAKYYVQEVRTNIYYQLNSTKYSVDASYQGQDIPTAKIQVNNGGIAIPNETKLGRITVTKTGEQLVGATTKPNKDDDVVYTPVYEITGLPGVKFDVIADEDIYNVYGVLLHKKGDVVDKIVTGSDGKASTKLLHLGRYVLVETEVPYGFVKGDENYSVTLGFDGQVTDIITKQISIHNERQKAEINLSKYCEVPENAPDDYNPYGGIVFGLYAKEDVKASDGKVVIPDGSLMEYITFDKNGKTEIKTDLPFGNFYVQEIKTEMGYVFNDTRYDFKFDYAGADKAKVVIDVNSGKPVENKLLRGSLKVIKTFEEKTTPISGVPFTVTGKTLVGTTVTINAVTNENGEILLENLLVGEYTVKELESELTVGYILSAEETTSVAANEIAELTINNKLQRGDLKIIKTFESKETPIKGVKFTVSGVSIAGIEFYGEFKTDENGEISIEGLPIGEYTVKEIGSKLTIGYVLSEEQTAVVATDEITEMTINNKLQRGDLKIVKTFESKDIPIAGVKFTVTGRSVTGIPFNQEFVTDENGEIFIEGLPIGVYRVQEIGSDLTEGYVLSKAQTVFIAQDKVAEVEINNKLQRGDLRIIKTFEGKSTPIEGVKFTVSGVSVAGIEFYGEFTTDENGEIFIEGLPIGDYKVQEIPSDLTIGYVLSEEQTAVIAADEVTEMAILNKLQRGSLKIVKTFEGITTPIAGVKFTVTGKTVIGDDFFGEYVTDENGEILIENLVVGEYKVNEIGSDLTEGYVLSDEQNAVVAADEITEMQINNKIIRGNVKIRKIDSATGNPLADAKFGLYTKDGKLFAEAVSNADGYAIFNDVPYGEYDLKELSAPNGYKKSDRTWNVSIKENGETVEFEINNDIVPNIPDIPQTGDNSNMGFWIGLGGIALGALIAFFIIRKKKDD